MSNASSDRLEQRILEMVFRNEQFEAGVSETMQSLEKLSRATSETVETINTSVVEGLGKAVSKADIDGFAKSINSIDLSGIFSGIEALNSKFSVFGTAVRTVVQDVTREVEHLAKSMMNVMTSGPSEGWKRYDMYTNTVKTLVNSAKDVNGAAVSLETVNKVLNDLNDYADQTIYSFADMTNNITKFTNAGVDLESAATAMKGIANLAAVSGANANEASRAMYNFGQALGSGFVRYIDWKSILNANMATLDFKQTLIDTAYELGTLSKEGDRYFSTLESGTNKQKALFNASREFDESLKDKWMTTEVLTAALAKYTDTQTEFGRKAITAAKQVNTFAKMIDIIKDALGSEWMRTYQLVFGNYEEATEFWTAIYTSIEGVINIVSKFRNRILETWKALGGRDDLIEGFANLWKILGKVLEPVADLMDKTSGFSDYLGDKVADLSRRFKEWTGDLAEFFGIVDETAKPAAEAVETVSEAVEDLTELAKLVIRGDYGNGEARREALEAEGKSYERIQNKVNELLGCSFRYEVQEEKVAEVAEQIAEETEEEAEHVFTLSEYMQKVSENVQSVLSVFSTLTELAVQTGDALLKYIVGPIAKDIPGAVLNTTSRIAEIADSVVKLIVHIQQAEWIPKFLKGIGDMLSFVRGITKKLLAPVSNFIDEVLALEEFGRAGSAIITFFDKFFDVFSSAPAAIADAFGRITDMAGKLTGFQALGKRVIDAGNAIKDGIIGAIKGVLNFFSDIISDNPISKFFDAFLGISDEIEDSFVADKWKFFEYLFSEDGLLNKAALAIDQFLDVVGGFISGFFKPKVNVEKSAIGAMASGFKLLENIKLPKAVEEFLSLSWGERFQALSGGFTSFFSDMAEYFSEFLNLPPDSPAFQIVLSFLSDFANFLKTGFDKAVNIASEAISNFLESAGINLPSFEWLFGENGLIQNATRFVTDLISKIKGFPQVIKDLDIFGTIVEKITGSEIYQKGQQVVQFFKDLFYTITHLTELESVKSILNTITTFFDGMKQRGLNVIERIGGYIEKAKQLPETIKNLDLVSRVMKKISENPFFKGIQKASAPVISFFKKLAKSVKEFVASDGLKLFGETLVKMFVMIGEGIVAVSGVILNFFNWLTTVPEKLSNFGFLEKLANAFQAIYSVGKTVVGFLIGLFEKLSHIGELEGVQKLLKAITEFFIFCKDTALEVLGQLLDYLDRVFGTNMYTDSGFINFFGEGGIIDSAAKVVAYFIGELEKVPDVLRKFGNFFTGTGEGTLIGGITGKFPALQKFFDKVHNLFTGIGKSINDAVPDLGISGLASQSKTSALGAFGGLFDSFKDFPKFSELIKKATGDVSGSIDDMGDTVTYTAEDLQNFSITGDDIVSFLQQMYPIVEDHVIPMFKEWAQRASELGANDWLQLFGKLAVVRTLFKISNAFANAAKGTGFFSDAMKEMSLGFTEFKNMWTGFADTPKKLNGMLDAFSKIPNSIGDLTKAVTDVKKLKPILKEWRKKPFTTALKDFAIAIALIAGSIWLLGSDFINYDKIKENGAVLASFAGFLLAFWGIAALMPPEKINGIARAFIGMGIGVLALAAAVKVFGNMDTHELVQGGVAVGLLMVALAIAAKQAAGMGKLAVFGFLAMALAIDILIPAVKAFGEMPFLQLVQGGVAVVIFMTLMATAVFIAGTAEKQAVLSFIAIALAIDLLVPAVYLFGKMDLETLVQGGLAVLTFMMIMSMAVNVASQNSALAGISFVSMVLAIGLLIPIILIISYMDPARVIGGGTAVVALMLSLAFAVKVATSGTNKEAIAAVVAMSLLVFLVGTIMVELARYDLSRVLGSAVALSAVLLALGYAFGEVSRLKITGMLAAMASMILVVAAIGAVFYALAELTDPSEILVIAISLSATVIALAFALNLTKRLDPGVATKAALAIDAFGAIVSALIGLLGAIDMVTEGKAIEAFNHFGLMIHALIEGVKGNTFNISDANQNAKELEETGGSLSSFADKITGFLDLLDGVDEGKAQAAKNLGDAIWQITKAEVLEGIGNVLGLKGDFSTFGTTLNEYVTSLLNFIDIIDAHESVADNEKLAAVEEATKRWMGIANSLKPNVGLIPLIAGISDMSEFGYKMSGFIYCFEEFNRVIGNIRKIYTERIHTVAKATGYMISVAQKLRPCRGLIPDIVGITDIGLFGMQLQSFMVGFKVFNNELATIETVVDPEVTRSVARSVAPMVELSKTLKREKSILSWIAGEKESLGKFGQNLGKFADGVVTFNSKLVEGGVSSVFLYSIATSLQKLGELSTINWSAFHNVVGNISTLATTITKFTSDNGMVKPENLDKLVSVLWRLRAAAISFSDVDLEKLSGFVEAMKGLADLSIKGFLSTFKDGTITVKGSIETYLKQAATAFTSVDIIALYSEGGTSLATNLSSGFSAYQSTAVTNMSIFVGALLYAITQRYKDFTAKGNTSALKYGSGIKAKQKDVSDKAGEVAKAAANEMKTEEVYEAFRSAGKYAGEGFEKGLDDKAEDIKTKAANIAIDAKNAAEQAIGVDSPSKAFRQIGMYASLGMALGFIDKTEEVEEAARTVANGSLATAMVAVQNIASLINENTDIEPTIRPVVDTSGIKYGIGLTNDMLNTLSESPAVAAALDISSLQNAASMQAQQANYTAELRSLVANTKLIIDAARQNRSVSIDGDYLFGYVNTRLGTA